MIVVASQGRVPAPVDDVWAVVRRLEALPAWLSGVCHVFIDGPEGLGRRLRLSSWDTGCGVERQAEIIAWKAPTLLAWRCVAQRPCGHGWVPSYRDETHLQLVPIGEHTQVRLCTAYHAGPVRSCLLRLGPARARRAELIRSVAALAGLFKMPLLNG